MGSSQIGYLVKIRQMEGEEADNSVAEVRRLLEQKQAALKKFLNGYNPSDENATFVDTFGDSAGDLPESFMLSEYGISEDATPELLDHVISTPIGHLVEEFSSVPADARDACWRADPDDNGDILLFAGTQTWGNEPDGMCYKFLRDSGRLFLWNALGIR